MEKIAVLVPTRGRVSSMEGLVKSIIETSDNKENNEVIFYIDDDDTESIKATESLNLMYGNVKCVIGGRIVLSDMWNKCFEASDSDIFMQCGDDIRIRTKGWDSIVRKKFAEIEDRIGFVFGYDGIQAKGHFGTHGFLHKNWVNTVGYFLPPYFEADYCDTWINDVAKMINRFYFIDIFTEHLHISIGKHELDETHKDRIKRYHENKVYEKYAQTKHLRDQDAEKLLEFIASQSGR